MYLTVSLSDVAGELGVTKPALYRHFRNKQALMDEMYPRFFDTHAEAIRADFERARSALDGGGGGMAQAMLTMSRAMAAYYAEHIDHLVFAMMQVYGGSAKSGFGEQMCARGVDLGCFFTADRAAGVYPPLYQLVMSSVFVTLVYFLGASHTNGTCKARLTPLSEEALQSLLARVEGVVSRGLGFARERVQGIDYARLEAAAAARGLAAEGGPLMKAVAEAVGEAGIWEASMRRVAALSGLSKSSLYGHFKSKRDMLRRLFMSEFDQILKAAGEAIRASAVTEEQVYLGVFAITDYFRARPEILIAMDRIRSRRIDLGNSKPPRFDSIFQGVDLSTCGQKTDLCSDEVDRVSHWVLFLIINTLMRNPAGKNFAALPNESIRTLYRFIAMGVGVGGE